jgi:hypothetical protein
MARKMINSKKSRVPQIKLKAVQHEAEDQNDILSREIK